MPPSPEHSSDDAAALDAQQQLLEDSLQLVAEIYEESQEDGIDQPVVILLDCEDEIGGQIARSWTGGAVDDAIADNKLEGEGGEEMTTVFGQAFAWSDCAEQIPAVFPYLQPMFDGDYPEGGLLAISVTAGGASALTIPPDALK